MLKLKPGRFGLNIRSRLYIRKKSVTVKVVRHKNRLFWEIVDAPSLEVMKDEVHRLDGAFSNLI